MNLNLFISRRLRAGDSTGRTSPAVKVAIASVALSIAIMILSVSIVGGFRREIVKKVTGFNSHMTLTAADERGVLKLTPQLDSIVGHTPGVTSSSLTLSAPVLLKSPESFKGLYLRGISADTDTAFLHSALTSGRLPARGEILMSRLVARHLCLTTGDSINLFMVSGDIRARKLRVSGVFDSHFENYDDYYAYTPIGQVQDLTGLAKDEGSSMDILTSDLYDTPATATLLIDRLNNAVIKGEINQVFRLDTAFDRGANYFAWLDMLDTNVWIILTLMTIVAVFTLISGILIIILEKVRFIGVMKAIGASSARLKKIFILLAVRIAAVGLIAGNCAALILIGVQYVWHLIPLNPEAYYIDFVPVSLSPPAIAGINAAFLIIIYMVLIIPANLVSRISPSESMRFEH